MGIVGSSNSYLMDGPSPGASVVEVVEEGHRWKLLAKKMCGSRSCGMVKWLTLKKETYCRFGCDPEFVIRHSEFVIRIQFIYIYNSEGNVEQGMSNELRNVCLLQSIFIENQIHPIPDFPTFIFIPPNLKPNILWKK